MDSTRPVSLFELPLGQAATVSGEAPATGGNAASELALRLFEIGFVEGERVRIVARGQPGGEPVAVAIALDRQEMGQADGRDLAESAVQQVQREQGLAVHAIATLADLLDFVQHDPQARQHAAAVQAYRARYGVGA